MGSAVRALNSGRRDWADLSEWWEHTPVPVVRLPGFGGAALFVRTHLRPAVGERFDTAHVAVDIGVMGPTFRRFYLGRRVDIRLTARLDAFMLAAASEEHPEVTVAALEDVTAGIVVAAVASTESQVTLEITIVEDLDDDVREFETLNFDTTRAALVSASHGAREIGVFSEPSTVFGSTRRSEAWSWVDDDPDGSWRPARLLHGMYPFEPLSRMTGITTNLPIGRSDNDVVLFSFIELGSDQDPDVEWDAIGSHLPFRIGGMTGKDAGGVPWIIVIQKAPADLFDETLPAPSEPPPAWWSPLVADGCSALVDSLARALWFNHDAGLANSTFGGPGILYGEDEGGDCFWTIDDLRLAYSTADVPLELIADWSVTELVWGLLAESCGVELTTVADGYRSGCALPADAHECQHDVFRDVFVAWNTGRLPSTSDDAEQPDPDDNEDDAPDMTTADFLEMLERMSRGELREMAVLNGWKKSDVKKLGKKKLISLLRTLAA